MIVDNVPFYLPHGLHRFAHQTIQPGACFFAIVRWTEVANRQRSNTLLVERREGQGR
jgi:hypothetical protein